MKSIQNASKVLIAVLIMLFAVTAVSADLEEAPINTLKASGSSFTLIDFEDAQSTPGEQYWDSHGVKFVDGDKATTIRISDYNRGGVATASGQYSISNDANYPHTSANVPIHIIFKEPAAGVAFYLGNGNQYGEQVTALITYYGANDKVIGVFQNNNVDDPVTQLISGVADEPIYKVTISYGNSILSEELDDVMFTLWDGDSSDQPATCSDPDGANIYTKGWAEGWNSYNNKNLKWGDHCAQTPLGAQTQTGAYIYEAVCLNGEVDYKPIQKCPNGYMCSDGACIEDEQSLPKTSSIYLYTKSTNKGAYMDWNDIDGLGSIFDKYNVRFNKGKTLNVPEGEGSFVDWGYYNLVNLTPGEYWTFQVCPTMNKEIVGQCSNTVTVKITNEDYQKVDVSNEASYTVWTRSHDEPAYGKTAKYVFSAGAWNYKHVVVSQYIDAMIVSPTGSTPGKSYGAKVTVKEDEPTMFVSFYSNQGMPSVISTKDAKQMRTSHPHTLAFIGEKDGNNVKVCKFDESSGKDCGSTYGSHSQELLYWGSNGFSTAYDAASPDSEELCTQEVTLKDKQSLDVKTLAKGTLTGGDFYFLSEESEYGPKFWANNKGQQGVAPINGEFTRFGVDTFEGRSYKVLTGNNQKVTFEVEDLDSGEVTITLDVACGTAQVDVNPVVENYVPEYVGEPIIELTSGCESGCFYDGKCLPIGTRIKPVRGETGLFCNWEGEMQTQSVEGVTCQNDYECSTNSCVSGTCQDFEKQFNERLERTENVLERILSWFERVFG